MTLSNITKEEKRWVFAFVIFLVLVTSLPYFLAFASQGEEWVFTGFLVGIEDGNSYIAKMRTGAEGAWLFRSSYTASEQNGALLYLPYLLLGNISGASANHLTLLILFHLFRILAIIMLSFTLYGFLALFLERAAMRKLSLALATLGGGMGWLLLATGRSEWLGSIPLDFYSPETFGFLALFSLPHLVMARALLLWGLTAYLKTEEDRFSKIALLWLLLALIHLLAALIGFFIILLHLAALGIWRRRSTREQNDKTLWKRYASYAVWAFIGLAAPLIYNLVTLLRDAYLQAWAGQNQILSPHPLHYLLAYSLFLPFVYFGARHLLRNDIPRALLPMVWLMALPFIVYVPIGLQRRLADGAWIALLIIALAAFEAGTFANKGYLRWVFVLAFPSTLLLLWGSGQVAVNPQAPAFRPAEEIAVIEMVRKDDKTRGLVLAAFETSNVLPAWAPLQVIIGHGPESVSLDELLPRVSAFYRAETPENETLNLLDEFSIDLVFWGPTERALGDWQPGEVLGLTLLYKSGDYSIYGYSN